MNDGLEAAAAGYLAQVDALGGAVAAIEAGFPQGEIERAAYAVAQAIDAGGQVVVGVNRFVDEGETVPVPVLTVDADLQRRQVERVRAFRTARDGAAVSAALATVEVAAEAEAVNVLPPMKEALRAGATLGEVSDALRRVFGEHERR